MIVSLWFILKLKKVRREPLGRARRFGLGKRHRLKKQTLKSDEKLETTSADYCLRSQNCTINLVTFFLFLSSQMLQKKYINILPVVQYYSRSHTILISPFIRFDLLFFSLHLLSSFFNCSSSVLELFFIVYRRWAASYALTPVPLCL